VRKSKPVILGGYTVYDMRAGVGKFRWRVKDEIEHRRSTILELQGAGYTIPQIAQKLGYATITIKKDSAFLHKQSQAKYQNHLEQHLPHEVELTLSLYKSIIRQAQELSETTQSEAVKVRALTLMKDARKEYQDLILRGEYVARGMDAAIKIKRRLDNLPNKGEEEEEGQEEEGGEEELEEVEEEEEKESILDHE
jgi:hypothetical protein